MGHDKQEGAVNIVKSVTRTVRGVLAGERSDGNLIKNLHPYRRMMAHIMRGRNESVVYFDTYARAGKLLEYIEKASEKFQVDITHCLVAAGAIGLIENPKMNRFVVGRRLYQRNGVHVTFSMKRQKLGREAKLSAVKKEIGKQETFRELCHRINAEIKVERSGKKTSTDKEFQVLDKLPRSALDGAVSLLQRLDHHALLPSAFIQGDAMYTSMFIANLGSLGMGPGYHHLYEWGNCPLFMMVGQIEKRPLVVDDEVVIESVIPIRWSYDERIDDGLNARFGIDAVNRVLETPFESLGCLKDDGSDTFPLGRTSAD